MLWGMNSTTTCTGTAGVTNLLGTQDPTNFVVARAPIFWTEGAMT